MTSPEPLPRHLAYCVTQRRRGATVADVAADLGVGTSLITRWTKKARDAILFGTASDPDHDLISELGRTVMQDWVGRINKRPLYLRVSVQRLGLSPHHELAIERLVESRGADWRLAFQLVYCDHLAQTAPSKPADLDALRKLAESDKLATGPRPRGVPADPDSRRQQRARERLERHASVIRNSIETYNFAAKILGLPELEDFPRERR